MVPGSHLSVILVVTIAVGGQERSKYGPDLASFIYRVVFLTGPPLKMSLDWPPQKCLDWPPPCFGKVLSMAAEKGEIPNTLTFSIPMGGQSGTLMFF